MKKVNIPLDQVREVRFNLNALVELEDLFNVPASQLFREDRVSYGLIRGLLYVGLKHGGLQFKGRTMQDQLDEAGELIQEHWILKGKTLKQAMDLITEAFKEAGIFNTGDDEEANPAQDTDGEG